MFCGKQWKYAIEYVINSLYYFDNIWREIMNITTKALSFNPISGDIIARGSADQDAGEFQITFRPRQIDSYLEKPFHFSIPVKLKDGHFEAQININDIFVDYKFSRETIFDLYYSFNCMEERTGANELFLLETIDYHVLDKQNFYQAKPYVTGDNKVSILVKPLSVTAQVNALSYSEGDLDLSFSLNKEIAENTSIQLSFRKREYKDLFIYHQQRNITTETDTAGSYSAKTNIINLLEDVQEDDVSWDSFVEINGQNQTLILPLETPKSLVGNITYSPFSEQSLYQVKPFINGMNALAIYMKMRNIQILADTDIHERDIHLKGTLSIDDDIDLSPFKASIAVKKRAKNGSLFEYYEEKVYPVQLTNQSFEQVINIDKLCSQIPVKVDDVWDFFLMLTDCDGTATDIVLKPSEKEVNFDYLPYDSFMFKLYVNGKGYYSFYFNRVAQRKSKAIKVAVLGSCFSRNPFNSTAYFNPDYKDYYDCILTQFHSSIASLTSTPMTLDPAELGNMSERNIHYLKRDFEKTFFTDLEKVKPDYLIIDLYADAAREMIKFNSGSIVSASLLLRETPLYQSLTDFTIISHANNDEYFTEWKKGMDLFAEKIKEILPEERIILNKGRFTYKYIDQDKTIKSFGNPNMIKRNNYFWDRLDNYFLYKLPHAQVIDLSNTRYTGHHKHPFGKTYFHYESGYYKEFINRLNKIVLNDSTI